MHKSEKRALNSEAANLRVISGAAPKIVGYAAVFNSLSGNLGGFKERIKPGAFSKVLKTCDCRALLNHDPNLILGRQRNGTLKLAEDGIGLRVEITPPDSSTVKHYIELIRRGDISGMSFTFKVGKESWEQGRSIRIVEEVSQLYDVGPVVYPAYEETEAALRSAPLANVNFELILLKAMAAG